MSISMRKRNSIAEVLISTQKNKMRANKSNHFLIFDFSPTPFPKYNKNNINILIIGKREFLQLTFDGVHHAGAIVGLKNQLHKKALI